VIKRTDVLGAGGIAHGSRMRTGRMTLACLAETGDGYRMHIVTGEAKPPPTWVEMGTDLPPWPGVQFEPDAPVRQILDHALSQHFAAVYGDWADELTHLCCLLDIEPVLDGPSDS
jgi:hypothetical protein